MTPKGPPVSSPDAKRIRPVSIDNATNPFDNAITPFPQMKEVKIGRQLTALVQPPGPRRSGPRRGQEVDHVALQCTYDPRDERECPSIKIVG
jgi:hypothetical protein